MNHHCIGDENGDDNHNESIDDDNDESYHTWAPWPVHDPTLGQ